jgi:hypothetical protein
MVHGTSVVAIGIALLVVVTGVIPAIFLRERLADVAAQENLAAHAEDKGRPSWFGSGTSSKASPRR